MAQLQQAQRRRNRRRRGVPAVIVIIIAAVVGIVLTSSGGGKKNVSTATSSTIPPGPTTTVAGTPPTAKPAVGGTLTSATACPKANGSSPRITTFKAPPPNCLDPGKRYSATFTTNEGTVVVALNTTKTPLTANNFIVLARYHYYDGTALFRTDTSIDIIQGGSPHTQSASDPGPGYTIKDEGSKYTYVPGDLTMARTSAPNSASAQYFFCAGSACSALNSQGTYVTFGTTTSGLPVLEKILGLNENTSGGLGGAPRTLVTVQKVTITES
jgi:cyclophilin family peptidyl-prolyl cis-trans isomerase